MTIVDRIKNLSGVPLYKLEEELGLANSSIRKWDKSVPTANKLYAVAKRLNVSMEYLLTGETTPTAKNFVNSPIIMDNDSSNIAVGDNNVVGSRESTAPTIDDETINKFIEKYRDMITDKENLNFWYFANILKSLTPAQQTELFFKAAQWCKENNVDISGVFNLK